MKKYLLLIFLFLNFTTHAQSFWKIAVKECGDFFSTSWGIKQNKLIYQQKNISPLETFQKNLQGQLKQTLEDTQAEASLRLRVALYIIDNDLDASLKIRADQIRNQILQDPANSGMKAFLKKINDDSMLFLDSESIKNFAKSQIINDFIRIALKKVSGDEATINYTEVLNDEVYKNIKEYLILVDGLLKDLKNPKLNSTLTSRLNFIEETLLNYAKEPKSKHPEIQKQILEEINLIKQGSAEQKEVLTSYLTFSKEKLTDFIKRANEEQTDLNIPIQDENLLSIISALKNKTIGPIEAFAKIKTWLNVSLNKMSSLNPKRPFYKKAYSLMDTINQLIFGKIDSDYISGKSVFAGNDGITQYQKRLFIEDHLLRQMSLDFYFELEKNFPKLESSKYNDPWSFWEKSPVDVWQLALEISKKYLDESSPMHALRMINLFGHNDFVEYFHITEDDLKNIVNPASKEQIKKDFELLNMLRPQRHSVLYAPGAIAGLNLDNKYLAQMTELKNKLNFFIKNPNLSDDLKAKLVLFDEDFMNMKVFRSGYYHFYGGFYFSSEFVAQNNAQLGLINLPITSSYLSGWFYKKITMENTYLTGDAKTLYFDGAYQNKKLLSEQEQNQILLKINNQLKKEFDSKLAQLNQDTDAAKIEKLKERYVPWSAERLSLAQLMVDINLVHLEITTYQHGKGAEWAYQALKKHWN